MSNVSYLDKARERRRAALQVLDSRTVIRSRKDAQPLELIPTDISDDERRSVAA
ncbi:MAG: hypothetical protein P8X50_10865 [Maritimibacter sp.]|jgi:hypothetical protein